MKVIVTGILGQDGSNMVEYLLQNTNAKIFRKKIGWHTLIKANLKY